MYRKVILISSLILMWGGCALSAPPIAPTSPLIDAAPIETTVFLSSPVECIGVVQLANLQETTAKIFPARLPSKKERTSRTLSPQQIITQAQKAARVEPSATGYFGGSGEHTFLWTPGRIYIIYLSPKSPTLLILPPGEKMVAAMYVDKDAYEVTTARAGHEATAYDTITVRPLNDTGEIDAFVLTESGRRYLFHFVTGTTGMQAVTFETAPVGDSAGKSPALVLPKPQR